jgi:diaminohydroxyphosphoribosylaminopyrimidine deaminase/5-amino-6-(5-phosphoribosylamino)uracil reductase
MFQQPGTTVVYTKEDAPKARVRRLEAAGAQIVRLPPDETGQVNLPGVLADLGSRSVVSLIVEGGGTVLGSFFDRGLVDKVLAFVSPVIVGGSGAASPVEGLGVSTMGGAWRVEEAAAQRIGEDWLITGYPRRQEQ